MSTALLAPSGEHSPGTASEAGPCACPGGLGGGPEVAYGLGSRDMCPCILTLSSLGKHHKLQEIVWWCSSLAFDECPVCHPLAVAELALLGMSVT